MEHLPETALPDHFQNLEVVETHGGIVQLGVLAAIVGIIATSRTLRVKRVVVAQVGKVDLLNARWRALRMKPEKNDNVRLNPHELLKRVHVLNVFVLHDLKIKRPCRHYTMKPILQADTNRIDSL